MNIYKIIFVDADESGYNLQIFFFISWATSL